MTADHFIRAPNPGPCGPQKRVCDRKRARAKRSGADTSAAAARGSVARAHAAPKARRGRRAAALHASPALLTSSPLVGRGAGRRRPGCRCRGSSAGFFSRRAAVCRFPWCRSASDAAIAAFRAHQTAALGLVRSTARGFARPDAPRRCRRHCLLHERLPARRSGSEARNAAEAPAPAAAGPSGCCCMRSGPANALDRTRIASAEPPNVRHATKCDRKTRTEQRARAHSTSSPARWMQPASEREQPFARAARPRAGCFAAPQAIAARPRSTPWDGRPGRPTCSSRCAADARAAAGGTDLARRGCGRAALSTSPRQRAPEADARVAHEARAPPAPAPRRARTHRRPRGKVRFHGRHGRRVVRCAPAGAARGD